MVTKPKAEKVEKNFQGFPVTMCRYEEEVDKTVFCPPCQPWREPKEGAKLCHECFLRPCMVKAKWNDIMGFCEDTMVFENDDSDVMYEKMINYAESLKVDIFGARFSRNHPLPGCVYELVGNYFAVKAQMEEAEGNPDDDLVAGSIDGTDYLTQSWQYSSS